MSNCIYQHLSYIWESRLIKVLSNFLKAITNSHADVLVRWYGWALRTDQWNKNTRVVPKWLINIEFVLPHDHASKVDKSSLHSNSVTRIRFLANLSQCYTLIINWYALIDHLSRFKNVMLIFLLLGLCQTYLYYLVRAWKECH